LLSIQGYRKVVVSALLFAHGRLEPLRLAWQSEAFIPLISIATAEKLVRVLSYLKFKLTTADCEELLEIRGVFSCAIVTADAFMAALNLRR